jgi:5-methylcytosine-specific restriction endonuclease McrA
MARKRTSPIWQLSDKEFSQLISESKSQTEALFRLGLQNRGNNNRTLKKRIEELGIDTLHFQLQTQQASIARAIPLKDVLVENSSYSNSFKLKRKLINSGLLQNTCQSCGQGTEWNGQPLVLQLDHINGTSTDNRIENLRLICPNCHSQTPTFAGRKTRKHFPDPNWRIKDNLKNRKVERPSKDELQTLLVENSFVEIGKIFFVSDNAVRKWAKRYCLI